MKEACGVFAVMAEGQAVANLTYFGLYAQRRKSIHGATDEDFATIKVKNAAAGLHDLGFTPERIVEVAKGVLAGTVRGVVPTPHLHDGHQVR